MKKKAAKKLIGACFFAAKLVALALLIAFFLIQFDTLRMTFMRAVINEALTHCPAPEVHPQRYEIILPEGDITG